MCKERNGVGSCSCLPEYFGDPYTGCRPECVINSDCDRSKACLNNKCKDPCPGTCGLNAQCRVINHAPSCNCLSGYTGDPLTSCVLEEPGKLIKIVDISNVSTKNPIFIVTPETPRDPCRPSPCGPNSQCRDINGYAVCSCQVGYIGTPPACRPECVVSSECSQDRACINQKCSDPCPGTCGINARCVVVNHNPICSCNPGHTGDPFIRCLKQEPELPKTPQNPCVPSPCGPNSQCKVVGTQPACSCLPNYVGRAPNCRPECTQNSECPSNLACQNEKCRNPCEGSCAQYAKCVVVNHNAICSCLPGYAGDPVTSCQPVITTTEAVIIPVHPCSPSPCGPNAECRERNGAGACICSPGYEGDPYDQHRGCKRECESNNECAPTLACISYKCVDPCPGTCGTYAECQTTDHIPICTCPHGYTGDPFFQCRQIPIQEPKRPVEPCVPSPCGPNSQCRKVNDQAVCSCLPEYSGSPPNCRPECVVSSECSLTQACINQKCADPCPNTCGIGAQCTTKNHNPICACPQGFTGDPFTRCSPQPHTEPPRTVTTERPPSCYPSPCGPNSQCQLIGNNPACSCLPNYIGSPPDCRPECVISSECASQLACINLKCRNPCDGSCGVNARCHVVNHLPICSCEEGHTGDPFTQCTLIPPTTPHPVITDRCNPSPCGPNAVCREGDCTCLPEYIGNPYESCRPECVLNSECSRDKACLRNKCRDPCPGTCGQNAQCDVINHIPVCSCPAGYTGDPFSVCRLQEKVAPPVINVCTPSPCGPNSECRNINEHAVCSCLRGFIGTPPNCRPECVVSAECPTIKACVNQKCTDPCLGSCGLNARCEVINHSPICSCLEGQTGDPFKSCYPIPPEPVRPPVEERDACQLNPCGPNAICQSTGRIPSCQCIEGYVGQPPNCRPECVINPDCPSNRACIRNHCVDPCPGSCGRNTECRLISHAVSCTCVQGFIGNPFVECLPKKKEERPLNPCEPSPCGANAICKERNGAGACTCINDYIGNPYEGCRPECVLSSDCPTNKACIRNKCEDPCPGVCGQYAQCSVINHVPTCTCNNGYIGDPFTICRLPPEEKPTIYVDPCNPSPCGPNAQCRNVNEQAVCSCLPEYTGSPPNCRPECVVNSECSQDKACHKFKCRNPCNGVCGIDAECKVINHNPICNCPIRMTGDPFIRCYKEIIETKPKLPTDPCEPSPCGPNSQCRRINDQASCSCLENYVGSPPNCRPECVVNTDCPSHLSCIREKCRDPCPGSCGFNAECRVQNHIPTCTCLPKYIGDPFVQCSPKPIIEAPVIFDVCNPSPCGPNADCLEGRCTCIRNYFGDPYVGCRPECTMNADCAPVKSCSNQRCIDPCVGTCGQSAICTVINHIPTCSCPERMEGDPFFACRPTKPSKSILLKDVK